MVQRRADGSFRGLEVVLDISTPLAIESAGFGSPSGALMLALKSISGKVQAGGLKKVSVGVIKMVPVLGIPFQCVRDGMAV